MAKHTQNSIWALAETANGRINPVSFEVIARAADLRRKLAGSKVVSVLVSGPLADDEVRELVYRGADEVICARDARLEHFVAHTYASVLSDLVRRWNPTVFLAAATTYGRTLMPYLAAKLATGLTADCTVLDIEEGTDLLLQTRPAIGGNILATIKTEHARPQMATVRPHSTEVLPPDRGRTGTILETTPDAPWLDSDLTFLGLEISDPEAVPITEARKIVAGGRGLGKADGFTLVVQLAEALEAAVGASREAVDRGWISYPHQIGLSGKTVTPDLYLAMGVSGAIQHLAGMQTAKHIIAINEDPEAQIFNVADLAIVGNLHEIVPPLIERIRTRNQRDACDTES
jgi:electron transfer flavoprotein alpha subunit